MIMKKKTLIEKQFKMKNIRIEKTLELKNITM